MRTQTREEKKKGKRIMLWSGTATLVIYVATGLIGYPSSLWTPHGVGDFFKAFLFAVVPGGAGIFLAGAVPLVQDWEVRGSPRTIYNALTGTLAGAALTGIITCAVLFIRYFYLILTRALT